MQVYVDNYLDGGYHIPHLHRGLDSVIDMASYTTDCFGTTSVQQVRARSARIGAVAVYAFLFPTVAINKFGKWMDVNVVVPTSPR